MELIMHANHKTKNVYKALIAAEFVDVKIKMVDNFEMGVSNNTPEFIKMNPMGTVPVLETPEGYVFGSNAIARYVARGSFLLGSSATEYSQIEQWIDFSSFELDFNFKGWILPRLGRAKHSREAEQIYIANIKRGLTALNSHLVSHTFLVGNSVTLADIITTCNLLSGFTNLMNKQFTSKFKNVETYFWAMVTNEKFKKVIGKISQAEVPLAFPSDTKT